MASLELGPLSNHLQPKQIKALQQALTDSGSPRSEISDDPETTTIPLNVEEVVLSELLDRLDANDALADVYVPGDFDIILDVAGYRVGSTQMLVEILEELRDELLADDSDPEETTEDAAEEDEEYDADLEDDELDFGDDDDEDEAEFDDEDDTAAERDDSAAEFDVKTVELRRAWQLLHQAAKACAKRRSCLFVNT